jgi:glutamate/tyrosine decarboxylase-like PLP-dependent enzyme
VETRALLHEVADRAADWLDSLGERPVGPAQTPAQLQLTGTLGDAPTPVEEVIADMVREAEPGLTAINSPRFFGFVMGGAQPAGIAADWLATAWDQNTGLAAPTPATAAFEEIAGEWLAELLGLPARASFALVTGCQMAHVTALAAARHRLLADRGHDAERDGLAGAPHIRVLANEERHVTVDRALRLLGIGTGAIVPVAADDRGAMRPDWTPEFSRRARGLAVYGTLRALGRDGVAELVDRLCACAERFAAGLADHGFEVLAQDLNQVVVARGDDDETLATLAAVQADGTCYPSGTTWRGRSGIRLSVCNWQTTFADIDRSVAAMAAVG